MKKIFFLLLATSGLWVAAFSQNVVFPRLTTAQRDAISNPQNGQHIFNTDERCLNYFDAVGKIWNCYCSHCEIIIINITTNVCKLDFFNSFAKQSPSKRYFINIAAGVTISGCAPGDTALSFSTMPFDASITINNKGTIAGAGGNGANGVREAGCAGFVFPVPVQQGGHAVSTKTGVTVTINNSGIVAGGGGGGGGSGKNTTGFGGGGGGGAGIIGGNGGTGGGTHKTVSPFNVCVFSKGGQDGATGQATLGGVGGTGVGGGFQGGKGGGRGQAGQNGSGTLASPGGIAGKAIGGGTANKLINTTSGRSFGAVD